MKSFFYIMTNFFILSPLSQFEVFQLIGLDLSIIGQFYLALTILSLYFILIFVTIISLHYYGNNDFNLVPNKISISIETSFASLSTMVKNQIGSLNEVYVPFIYTLFFFILFGNLISNIPYSFAVNASAIVTLGLSLTIFLGVTILSLAKHGIKFFSFFIPSGTPLALVPLLVLIELLSYSARAFSLGIRLFANMTAGHTLLKILSTFLLQMFSASIIVAVLTLIPFAIFMALIGLELAVSFIQSYVFCILTCSYIRDAIELH